MLLGDMLNEKADLAGFQGNFSEQNNDTNRRIR
jgi:hypothetical protein